jgi:hypothetical protein
MKSFEGFVTALVKLFRHRYGRHLPNDDAGTDDLWLLIQNVSLVPYDADRRVRNAIETWAPWLSADEVEARINFVMNLTTYERWPTAKELGIRLNVTNDERAALGLWWLKPVDMDDDELEAWRKQRKRERQAASRKARGRRTRAQYLADMKAKPKPWEAEGISQRQWQRRKCRGVRSNMSRGLKQINSSTQASHLTTSSVVETQRRIHEVGLAEKPNPSTT